MLVKTYDPLGGVVGMMLIIVGTLGGCATTPSNGADTAKTEGATSPAVRSRNYPPLTVNARDYETLGQLVRGLGESEPSGGIVLLSGLEERPAPPLSLTRSDYRSGLERLVAPLGLRVLDKGTYQFVLPPGYEALAELSVAPQLHPEIAKRRASLALGSGTDLFNALAVLTTILDVTVLADNAIADVWCGELFLHDVPAAQLLDAVLQSARVLPDAVAIECTADYVFVRSTANSGAHDRCLNRAGLTPDAAALLARRLSVRLPAQLDTDEFQYEVASLASVLDTLSTQLGVAVDAEVALREFPVNRAFFKDMTVNDVLNLIVRQWPVSDVGFRVEKERIVFARQ